LPYTIAAMNEPVIAAVGLGSNLGDRERTLRDAVHRIADLPGVAVCRVSEFVNTSPVGPVAQPDFLNAALTAAVDCDALEFMRRLHGIERDFGRDRTREERWGPRTLDLDLLLFGQAQIDSAELKVPHPSMLDREFVLGPLSQVAPEHLLPCGLTVLQALQKLRLKNGAIV
jgi:2-amino-4-hydroxy-6-hydroxymethyldihydropteridine diphosphokinase